MRRRVSKPLTHVSPVLERLGLATPPPFVGREEELGAIAAALNRSAVVTVHGAVGAGKSRLAQEITRRQELFGHLQVTRVRCAPGDLGMAVRARAERATEVLPNSLDEVLRSEPRLLILDDVHHLTPNDAAKLIESLISGPAVGRLLLLSRDLLPLRKLDALSSELALDGLDENAARDLWAHLEDLYGPTPACSCDRALVVTRGMPLAMRREYARSAFGESAWRIENLEADARAALDAISVMALPAAPAAVASLVPEIDVNMALTQLVSLQLVDPDDSGRFSVHDVVRDETLGLMDSSYRQRLERSAAELIEYSGRRAGERRYPTDAVSEDGALELMDDCARLCETTLHLLASGDVEGASERLRARRHLVTQRGAAGELLALVDRIERAAPTETRVKVAPILALVRAEVAVHTGNIAVAREHESSLEPVLAAEVRYRSGDVSGAHELLSRLASSSQPGSALLAAAALAELELARGDVARAHGAASDAFEVHSSSALPAQRARLHLALAAIERTRGCPEAARAALSRAACAVGDDLILAARIEIQRVHHLIDDCRFREAGSVHDQCRQLILHTGASGLAEELSVCEARIEARVGSALAASLSLEAVAASRRGRGDEVGALDVELYLAEVMCGRGQLAAAGELADSVMVAARRLGLNGFARRAELVVAAVEVSELRTDSALDRLAALSGPEVCDSVIRQRAARIEALALAVEGHADSSAAEAVSRDSELGVLELAEYLMASGASTDALAAAREAAVRFERGNRIGAYARAMALVARLELASGDQVAAEAAASRAARDALASGQEQSRVVSLLVLASLARDQDRLAEASTYARDALALATTAGLPVERLAATSAVELIADGQPAQGSTRSRTPVCCASMPRLAVAAADRLIADLGLSAVRPFRVVQANGDESFVAEVGGDRLGAAVRTLVIDAVNEAIISRGEVVADLRRRTLLKRLLFFFARQPGRTFSKEEIVESVWEVEYHPLRHDAALFTNIMRLRRLLGDAGAERIRAGEDGYQFAPPDDALYVERVQPC